MTEHSAAVLLVGRHEAFASVATTLRRVGYRASAAADGSAALASITRRRPLVVVIHAQLEDITAYELCHELRGHFGQDLPIVLASTERGPAREAVAALLLGADDYLPAPLDPETLLVRVRRLAERRTATLAAAQELTDRELQVLNLLADGASQREIAHRLVISSKTVATHIQHILLKLDVHSRAEAVAAAYRHGLVQAPR